MGRGIWLAGLLVVTTGCEDRPTNEWQDASDPPPQATQETADTARAADTGEAPEVAPEATAVRARDLHDGLVEEGTLVEIAELVVTAQGPDGVYAQDRFESDHGGVFIPSAGPGAQPPALADRIRVVGVYQRVEGQVRVAPRGTSPRVPTATGHIQTEGAVAMPSPVLLDLTGLTDPLAADAYQSMVVRLIATEPLLVNGIDDDGTWSITVEEASSVAEVDARIFDAADALDLEEGGSLTLVQGPLHRDGNGFRLAPRSATDVFGYEAP